MYILRRSFANTVLYVLRDHKTTNRVAATRVKTHLTKKINTIHRGRDEIPARARANEFRRVFDCAMTPCFAKKYLRKKNTPCAE